MIFLLDTSVAIHLRDLNTPVAERVEALDGEVFISMVTRVELEGGVVRDPAHRALRRERVDLLLATLEALPFDGAAADRYREIVEATGFSRPRIIDRMIAAQARAHDATLVTMNGQDFRDIPRLKLLAW